MDRGQVWAHPLDGYWRDLGRPETYFAAHQDLLDGSADLFDADWPLHTNGDDRLPARLRTGSQIEDSLISPGCDVGGTVRRSVLGPGVRVAAGAVVEQCVIFDDVRIERGARLTRVIAADGAVVGADVVVGAGTGSEQPPTTEQLTLIGRESSIGDGQVVGPGARLEPGTNRLSPRTTRTTAHRPERTAPNAPPERTARPHRPDRIARGPITGRADSTAPIRVDTQKPIVSPDARSTRPHRRAHTYIHTRRFGWQNSKIIPV